MLCCVLNLLYMFQHNHVEHLESVILIEGGFLFQHVHVSCCRLNALQFMASCVLPGL